MDYSFIANGRGFILSTPGRQASVDEIERARTLYEREGEIEIDDDARVSETEGHPDGGFYISAWVWVPDSDAEGIDD